MSKNSIIENLPMFQAYNSFVRLLTGKDSIIKEMEEPLFFWGQIVRKIYKIEKEFGVESEEMEIDTLIDNTAKDMPMFIGYNEIIVALLGYSSILELMDNQEVFNRIGRVVNMITKFEKDMIIFDAF